MIENRVIFTVVTDVFDRFESEALNMSDSRHSVSISLDTETLDNFRQTGTSLYVFRAVDPNGILGGKSLVWKVANNLFSQSLFSWDANYGAFISTEQKCIQSRSDRRISLGQIMDIDNNGLLSIRNGGEKDTISILNENRNLFTCGISEYAEGANTFAPMCAFSINYGFMVTITPVQKLLLMFSSAQIKPTCVVKNTSGPGIIMDFTTANNRTVSYNIQTGWNSDTLGDSIIVNAGTEIAPLLMPVSIQKQIH